MFKTVITLLFCLFTLSVLPVQADPASFPRSAEQEISASGLSATLLLPRNHAILKTMPVVLIVAGSGPVDRDGNAGILKNNSLKFLAEGLAENGIASLRYDKRGIAKSATATIRENDLRFSNNSDDALIWYNLLAQDKRFSGIILLGHSEGALVVTLAAQAVQNAPQTKLKGVVLLAGAGSPASAILKAQLIAARLPDDLLKTALDILQDIEAGHKPDNIPPTLNSLFRPSVQDYLISWFALDPAKELAHLTIPVLIISGGRDFQVPPEEGRKLEAANTQSRLLPIETMNHVLKSAPEDRAQNLSTYSDPDLQLAPQLIPAVVDFIQKLN